MSGYCNKCGNVQCLCTEIAMDEAKRQSELSPATLLACADCKYYVHLKTLRPPVSEGMCRRYPPTIHPRHEYIPGASFSEYPLVESTKEACGEYRFENKNPTITEEKPEPKRANDGAMPQPTNRKETTK